MVLLKQNVSPSVDDIKNFYPEFVNQYKDLLNFLIQELGPRWSFYFRPHLNGLCPDIVLLHPEKGIQVINFYSKDSTSSLLREFRNLLSIKEMITEIYSPRMRLFFLELKNSPFGRNNPLISVCLVVPNLSKDKISEALKLELEKNKITTKTSKKYYPILSKESIQNLDIHEFVPMTKYPKSMYMKDEYCDDLRSWLTYSDEKKESYKPIILDDVQEKLASSRTKSGYRRIKGSAGSGKTAVLAKKAVNLALSGKKVVVLSFNITLYRYILSLIMRFLPDSYQIAEKAFKNIELYHYHGWAPILFHELISEVNDADAFYRKFYKKFPEDLVNEEFSEEKIIFENEDNMYLFLLDNYFKKSEKIKKYDAILVDEGQDWSIKMWNVARSYLKTDGEILLVADQTQDIYGTGSKWTEETMTGAGFGGGRWGILKTSYRLPESYTDYVSMFAELFIRQDEEKIIPESKQTQLDIEVCHRDWKQLGDFEDTTKKCIEVISSSLPIWMKEFPISDITFLAATNDKGKMVIKGLKERNINVTHTFGHVLEAEDNKPISEIDNYYMQRAQKMVFSINTNLPKATTIHSFKGWESPAIVIQIEGKEGKKPSKRDVASIYTALTRLRDGNNGISYINVICSDPYFEEYQKYFNN